MLSANVRPVAVHQLHRHSRRLPLIHGDDDRNVPFQQTTDLVEKLRTHKVEFEELIIPDEIHDFLRWDDWVRACRATGEFFDRKLSASGERK